MHFTDCLVLDEKSMRRTGNGYAIFSARVARGGNVQVYAGDEMGMPDRREVRIYRPEAAVFAQDAIKSFAGVPITIGHPKGDVTSETWKDLAVGEVGDEVMRDGEFVRVPMMLRDAKAISTVESGTRQLSMGYDAELTMRDGVTPAGEPYDAVMSDFRMNHVAIVDQARGGAELRIGDGANRWGAAPISTTDRRMHTMSDALRSVVVDGLSVMTTDQGAQAIAKLQKAVEDAEKKLTTAEQSHKDALDAKDKEIATRDSKIEELEKKVVSDADLDKRVEARAALVDKARKVAKDVKTDGLTDAEIRKAVVVAKLGDEKVEDRSEAYIEAFFDSLVDKAGDNNGNTDPLRTHDGLKPNDGAHAWSDSVFKRAGVPMKKEA